MKKTIILIYLICFSTLLKAQEFYQVNTERLNVRAKPSAGSPSIGFIPYGENVMVLDSSSKWYKIKVKNAVGYVKGSFLIKNGKNENNQRDVTTYNLKVVGIAAIFIVLLTILYYLFKPVKKTNQMQPIDISTNISQQQIIFKRKSVGVAILLALIFGPFGMFYSTIKGALTMLLLPILGIAIFVIAGEQNLNALMMVVLIWLIFFASFYWIICVVWAGVAANNSNKIKLISYSNS